MALTISQAGSNSDAVSGSSLTVSSITASVGDMLIVACYADNAGTGGARSIGSASDSASNTYNERISVNRDPSSANAGVTLVVWTSLLTSALSGGTVTVNFSPDTTNKGIIIYKCVPDAGEIVEYLTAGSGASGDGTPTITSSTITNGESIFGFCAWEYGSGSGGTCADSDTTNGSWSTVWLVTSGNGTSGARIASQYKTVNANGTQTYNPSTSLITDWAMNWLSVRPFTAILPPKTDFYFRRRK